MKELTTWIKILTRLSETRYRLHSLKTEARIFADLMDKPKGAIKTKPFGKNPGVTIVPKTPTNRLWRNEVGCVLSRDTIEEVMGQVGVDVEMVMGLGRRAEFYVPSYKWRLAHEALERHACNRIEQLTRSWCTKIGATLTRLRQVNIMLEKSGSECRIQQPGIKLEQPPLP